MKKIEHENIILGIIVIVAFAGLFITYYNAMESTAPGTLPKPYYKTTNATNGCPINLATGMIEATTIHLVFKNDSDIKYIAETFKVYDIQNNYLGAITTRPGTFSKHTYSIIRLQCGKTYILQNNNLKSIRIIFAASDVMPAVPPFGSSIC